MTRKCCFIHIFIYYIVHDFWLLYFFSRSRRAGIFSHVFPLSQRTLVRKSTNVFTTLGGNTGMVNSGNQTVVCSKRDACAPNRVFPSRPPPSHQWQYGGWRACSAATVTPSTSHISSHLVSLARASSCTYVFVVRQFVAVVAEIWFTRTCSSVLFPNSLFFPPIYKTIQF